MTEHPKPQWVESYRGDYLEKTSEDLANKNEQPEGDTFKGVLRANAPLR